MTAPATLVCDNVNCSNSKDCRLTPVYVAATRSLDEKPWNLRGSLVLAGDNGIMNGEP